VEEEGKDEAGSEDIFNLEGVDGRVMRWSVSHLHEVENIAAAADEKQFHDRVVYGYEVEEKVKISCEEDANVEGLCFKGYAST